MKNALNPHKNATIFTAGTDLLHAKAAVILIHGRGSSAANMLSLFKQLGLEGISAIAPEATGNTWYPYSFLAEITENQPYLNSALELLDKTVTSLNQSGIPDSKIILLGFSQGACLVSEFAARNPKKYGGLIILTGGLIGPAIDKSFYKGNMQDTPVFIGSSDPDSHVPLRRVHETADVLRQLGAQVELRTYPGMPHIINQEEIEVAKEMIIKSIEE